VQDGGSRDSIESRRYSIWERLGDIFRVEPQIPGTGGKFRLSTIVTPIIDAEKQLQDNGLFAETIAYSATSGAALVSAAIPSQEKWVVYVVSWVRDSGDNVLTNLSLRGTSDSGFAAVARIHQPAASGLDYNVTWPGGIICPGGTSFAAQLGGVGVGAGEYIVTIWHQKMPESGLLPVPPFA